jgi:hypothetical protein
MENVELESASQTGTSPSARPESDTAIVPRAGAAVPQQACTTCGTPGSTQAAQPQSFIYAIGKIEPRFRDIYVEKEFAQATGRVETKGLTDHAALRTVLAQPENRYLVRQLCWVVTIRGVETYLLVPRDPMDFALLVETLRSRPTPSDLDVVIGVKGPIAPPQMCNGLLVPIVFFDQIYSFDQESLINSIPKPEKANAKEFAAAAEELFSRIMRITDNAGATDEHRALNYLAVRYPAIYARAVEYFDQNCTLSRVEVRASPLSGVQKLLDVIFTYTNRNTDVEDKCFARVAVSHEWPHLHTKLSHFYDC